MIDDSDIAPLVKPVIKVWNAIGFDLYVAVTNCGFNLTNDIAIESCIDHSHLLTVAGDMEAHIRAQRLIKEFGMSAVVDELAKHLQLT